MNGELYETVASTIRTPSDSRSLPLSRGSIFTVRPRGSLPAITLGTFPSTSSRSPAHPVSYVRQQMLKHAFSYLPVRAEDTWWLIPEFSVARYLRGAPSPKVRKKRLATRVDDAIKTKELCRLKAEIVDPEAPVTKILKRIGERPILIVNRAHQDELVGVLTSSDVL